MRSNKNDYLQMTSSESDDEDCSESQKVHKFKLPKKIVAKQAKTAKNASIKKVTEQESSIVSQSNG